MATKRRVSHLEEVGEGYGEHFGHAAGFGVAMIAGGVACLVHAIFPSLFATAGSDTVRRLHGTLCKRADKPNWERHPII